MGFTDLGGSRFRRFGGMNGINTSHNVGVNFNVGKGEEFRVGGDVSYNNSNRNVLQRTERQNLFADSTSYYSGHNKMNDHGQNIRGNFRIHWEIDSLNTLEFRPKFAVALSRSDSYDSALTTAGDLARSKVNFSESDNFNKGTGYDLSGELIYNHKFLSRPGRSFSIQAEYKFSDTKEDGWTKALYKYYQLATDSTLDQIDDDHTWSNGYRARLTWTEPLGDVSKGRFLTFSYRFQANFNNADKFTYDVFTDPLTALPLDTLRNDDLSNSFRNDYYMHRAQVGFKQVKPTYTYDVGVAVEPSSSQSIDRINSNRNIPKRTVFNVAPYLRYRYKMGKQTSLRIDYRGSSSQPTMAQLQPVADVSDQGRMENIFKEYRPQYIFHAAAYKHVPMMENNVPEAIRVNVLGTRNLADLSVKYGAEKFVMISTDKAVNPTNVMGCSKRIAEIYVQSLAKHLQKKGDASVKFITTRFGNVLGSNGSVIPRFKEQIQRGGPVTVTHPDIIRYFMTIPEACRLVLEAGSMGNGGEIYIFDMGQPVKIVDLAKRMISLSGRENIKIEFTGLRHGEKLYEELLNNKELTKPTYHPKIMIANVREYDYGDVQQHIQNLIDTSHTYDPMKIVAVMKDIVPEFVSKNSCFEVLDKK